MILLLMALQASPSLVDAVKSSAQSPVAMLSAGMGPNDMLRAMKVDNEGRVICSPDKSEYRRGYQAGMKAASRLLKQRCTMDPKNKITTCVTWVATKRHHR